MEAYLPIGGQKVLDKGVDLPLPLGLSLLYVHLEQDQLFDSLQGGLNGGEVVPLDFVSFDNAESLTDSVQLRFDAWLLPLINVYAMLGLSEGFCRIQVR